MQKLEKIVEVLYDHSSLGGVLLSEFIEDCLEGFLLDKAGMTFISYNAVCTAIKNGSPKRTGNWEFRILEVENNEDLLEKNIEDQWISLNS